LTSHLSNLLSTPTTQWSVRIKCSTLLRILLLRSSKSRRTFVDKHLGEVVRVVKEGVGVSRTVGEGEDVARTLGDGVWDLLEEMDVNFGEIYPKVKVGMRYLLQGKGGGTNVVSGMRVGGGLARVGEEETRMREGLCGEAIRGWMEEVEEGSEFVKEIEEAFEILIPRWDGGGGGGGGGRGGRKAMIAPARTLIGRMEMKSLGRRKRGKGRRTILLGRRRL